MVLALQSTTLDKNMNVEAGFGYGRVPEKFEGNRRGLDNTRFATCQFGHKI